MTSKATDRPLESETPVNKESAGRRDALLRTPAPDELMTDGGIEAAKSNSSYNRRQHK